MQKQIYFITSSYPGIKNTGGGAQIREAQVTELVKNDFNVNVIVPNTQNSETIIQDNIIQVPFGKLNKLDYYKTKLGIQHELTEKWVKNSVTHLKDTVRKSDTIFATTGGELAPLKIGVELKKRTNCKLLINYHDPLNFTTVFGKKRTNSINKNFDHIEQKLLSFADIILTSSASIKEYLCNKYPLFEEKFIVSYFGYTSTFIPKEQFVATNNIMKFGYGGIFSSIQKPEILLNALSLINNVKAVFIGNLNNYSPLAKTLDSNKCDVLGLMPHDEFLSYFYKNIHVGFVSIVEDFYGVCIPSKIYEYINLEKPILAALPNGEAKNIINNLEIGIAKNYNDEQGLSEAAKAFTNPGTYNKFLTNIRKIKSEWSMENKMKNLITKLNEL